ncbi:hypothetical protein BH11ARM2_BH11ARM2_06590 [soil metagenome]
MEPQRKVQWLVAWNIILTGLIVIPLLIERAADIGTPKLWQTGSLLHVSSQDGPFVITYVKAGPTWAALEPPIVITESTGLNVDTPKLRWHDYKGEPIKSPTDTNLQALFYRPNVANSPEPKNP